MQKLSERYNLMTTLKPGDIVRGKILAIEGSAVFVDLSPQGTGIIWGKEFFEVKDKIKKLTSGEEIVGKIIEAETEDGFIELSLRDAQKEALWQELAQKKENGAMIKVKIVSANKGGLLSSVNGIPAFLPVSQLSTKNYPKVEGGDPQKILKELQKFIGKEMEVNIFSLNQTEGQIILSEKLKETTKKKEALKKYKIGDIVEGEITGICDFGAFLKFLPEKVTEVSQEDPLEGLIHISELDWGIVENPEEIVKVGEKVRAKILEIQDEKVFLSLKQLKENPWQKIEKKLKKGDIIKGKVKKLNPYGALVEVLPKIQGLCHISEFSSQKRMEEELKIGKTYNFKILMIDPKEYKITLKLLKQ